MEINWPEIWKEFNKLYRKRDRHYPFASWRWQKKQIAMLVDAQLSRKPKVRKET